MQGMAGGVYMSRAPAEVCTCQSGLTIRKMRRQLLNQTLLFPKRHNARKCHTHTGGGGGSSGDKCVGGKIRFSVWCRNSTHENFCAMRGTSCPLCILSGAVVRCGCAVVGCSC